jgi:N-acetylglucosaminyl-diphospho-decaprenol L-rhamnosyltransferase
MVSCDVVVVSYNSGEHLRACVEGLASAPDVHVIVVDNASGDGSLDTVSDLLVERIAFAENLGFAHGCNAGWRSGAAEYVLFLNPDARLDPSDLDLLAGVLDAHPAVGAVGPRIVDADGTLDYSIRRFPRLSSRYAQALFLHRAHSRASWVDEVVRDERVYAQSGPAEWLSGACLLVRRSSLVALAGLDDGFFLYCDDMDLCRRLWDGGARVWFEPSATCAHLGGASAPRAALLPVLAASRLRYARKHFGPVKRICERAGIALGALTHVVVASGGAPVRAGHARSLRVALVPGAAGGLLGPSEASGRLDEGPAGGNRAAAGPVSTSEVGTGPNSPAARRTHR